MNRDKLLDKITTFYLDSHDYNGMAISRLVAIYGEAETREYLSSLVSDGLASVIFGDLHPNPHIKALPSEPEDEQRKKLDTLKFSHACVYPTPKHLQTVVDPAAFSSRPYALCLALGEAQLEYKAFDLSVLELYRNDPRYSYEYDDIHGHICIKDEFYEKNNMKESDKVLLESFGFSFDGKENIYVAAFLRYLSRLTPEHQLMWASKQVDMKTYLHPDYYRTSIIGDWPERLSLFQAVLLEMKTINEICSAIARKPLLKDDFAERRRPREFGYLLRPTSREYNEFVHLLDKMLSENINREFFNTDVPFETEEKRSDGKIVLKAKGTIQILNDWLRKEFRTNDRSQIEEMLQTLKHVRNLRQKPAHSIKENEFDQGFIRKQRELMLQVYWAVKTIRLVLSLHPLASKVAINRQLEEGQIWSR
jgi:hypothetical protein